MMPGLTRGLILRAAKRGLIGGSRPWLVILVVLVGGRVVRWAGSLGQSGLKVSERLEVGDRLEVATIRPPEVTE